MKSIRSYWRVFKAGIKEGRTLNRSTSPNDPDWREARINSLVVRYEEGFIHENEFLREIDPTWNKTNSDFDYVIKELMGRGEGKVRSLVSELMIEQVQRRTMKTLAKSQELLIERQIEEQERQRLIQEQESFDNAAFIRFLEK